MSLTERKKSLAPNKTRIDNQPLDKRGKLVSGFAKLFGRSDLIKKTQSMIPQYAWDTGPKLRRPDYDYLNLVVSAQFSWMLRKVFQSIIKECTKMWGDIEPRFKLKCHKCGLEFQEKIDKCPICKSKGKLKEPKPEQKLIFANLIKNPSPDRTFLEFMRATFFYALATDDFYWSLVYHQATGEIPLPSAKEVHVEHPGFLYPVGDEFGNLGGYQYYCPVCYTKPEHYKMDICWDIREEYQKAEVPAGILPGTFLCPECGMILVQTAYVQEVGGKIVARFGKNEIVHGSASRLPPELFGNPRLQSLVKLVNTLEAIDSTNLESRTEGKVGGLLGFPGLDQDQVTEILTKVKKERTALTIRDAKTGELETEKKTALIFVGLEEGGEPTLVPFMNREEAEKTLEIYRLYMNAIDEVYGVVTTLSTRKGGGGNIIVRLVTEAKRDTALEWQRLFSESFNNGALPLFGITDWIWIFNKLEPKDQLREVEIQHQQAAAVLTAIQAGLSAKIVDGELEIEGEGKLLEYRTGRQGLPNTEGGVSPRRTGRETVTPFEISPRTGEEIRASDEELLSHVREILKITNYRGKHLLGLNLTIPILKGDKE